MTPAMLTRALAERGMGWRSGRGRFLTGAREWISESQFQPLTRIDDAFKLLRKVASEYCLSRSADGTFTAKLIVGNRSGAASALSEPIAVALAVARSLGIEIEGLE